jgi:hypothetical protein
LSHFSSKGIKFSGDSIKSCVGLIDLVDSPKNITTMEGLKNIRKYYSTFINSVSNEISSNNGKVIKNIGDCLLFYFPKTSDINDANSFQNGIGCCFEILEEQYKINNELSKQHLPPFNYRISMDYGIVDLALVGDYSQIDLFGSTLIIFITALDILYELLNIVPGIPKNQIMRKPFDKKEFTHTVNKLLN